jgi:hypothetical protein
MNKILTALVAALAVLAATLTSVGGAAADPLRHYPHRIDPWRNPNFWGHGGWSRGGWGLGGPADGFVGGELIPVTPYGPYPYGPFLHGAYP